MEYFKENFLGIFSLIAFVTLYVFYKKNQRKLDEEMIYTKENVGGEFVSRDGKTCLKFKYSPTIQFRKKEFILDYFKQGDTVINARGDSFVISELISELEYEEPNKLFFKGEASIVFKVISKTEMEQSSMSFGNVYAPVQIATNGSTASQVISDSSFTNKVKELKDIMIDNGISKEDIEIVIQNPKNEHIKQSFLSKYGLELAKLSVDVSGKIISLLTFFQS